MKILIVEDNNNKFNDISSAFEACGETNITRCISRNGALKEIRESLTNNSIKEYYVKLLNLYNNAVNMITALNQSLSSSSAEINVSLVGDDDTETTLRIPSMLYLENKLEQLDNKKK